jgi:hypothetical protein
MAQLDYVVAEGFIRLDTAAASISRTTLPD